MNRHRTYCLCDFWLNWFCHFLIFSFCTSLSLWVQWEQNCILRTGTLTRKVFLYRESITEASDENISLYLLQNRSYPITWRNLSIKSCTWSLLVNVFESCIFSTEYNMFSAFRNTTILRIRVFTLAKKDYPATDWETVRVVLSLVITKNLNRHLCVPLFFQTLNFVNISWLKVKYKLHVWFDIRLTLKFKIYQFEIYYNSLIN